MTNSRQTEVMPDTPQTSAPYTRLPHQAREVIGSRLRHLYGSLVAEPLPERFQDLLVKLAAAEARQRTEDEPSGPS